MFRELVLSIVALVAGCVFMVIYESYYKIPPIPELDDNDWYGPRNESEEDPFIRHFKLRVPKNVLKDLEHRLVDARPLTPSLQGTKHQYGLNTKLLSKFIDFWRTKYNWTEQEKFLNQYPQYTVVIQGLRIHFIHVAPRFEDDRKVFPILLLHSSPGSVREYYELIPFLTQSHYSHEFVFEVIVPSLPGYGFSEGATRPGLGAVEVAGVLRNLMLRIGYTRWFVVGGGWGGVIPQYMSIMYPENVLGTYSNVCPVFTSFGMIKLWFGRYWPSFIVDKEHKDKVYPLKSILSKIILETGYLHLQATKPDTFGVALKDSPVGLAAYILEMFITQTNKGWIDLDSEVLLQKKFSFTKLLDNVMIYWLSGSITTSMRLYAESFNKTEKSMSIYPVKVPSACARFPNELIYYPTSILKEKYEHLVHVSDFDDGGHYAAFELPRVVAKDIYRAVTKMLLSYEGTHRNKINVL